MGQFSFAPATKTTVVTTTYTTTMTFPPLPINTPGSLGERDPKEYPLAHVQAPESIRKIYFKAGGDLACFEEADAASSKVQEVRDQRVQGWACHHSLPCQNCSYSVSSLTYQPTAQDSARLTAILQRQSQKGRVVQRASRVRNPKPYHSPRLRGPTPSDTRGIWPTQARPHRRLSIHSVYQRSCRACQFTTPGQETTNISTRTRW